jgi:hypothetical protein
VNALCSGPVETPLLLRIYGVAFVVDGGLTAAYVTPESSQPWPGTPARGERLGKEVLDGRRTWRF